MAAGGENRWPYLGRNRWPLTLLPRIYERPFPVDLPPATTPISRQRRPRETFSSRSEIMREAGSCCRRAAPSGVGMSGCHALVGATFRRMPTNPRQQPIKLRRGGWRAHRGPSQRGVLGQRSGRGGKDSRRRRPLTELRGAAAGPASASGRAATSTPSATTAVVIPVHHLHFRTAGRARERVGGACGRGRPCKRGARGCRG